MPAQTRPLAQRLFGSALAAMRVSPSLCAVCHAWGDGRICEACRVRFGPAAARCTRCALRVPDDVLVCGECLMTPPVFDGGSAAVDYGYPWDGLIAALKFRDALDLTSTLAGPLVCSLPSGLDGHLFLPVPLSNERLRSRGYNQAWELCRRAARRIGAKARADVLLRTRDAVPQADLPRNRREANVSGAFALDPRRGSSVEGRHVVVVDDVMTTGATMAEVARTLHRAGAISVHAAVLARTAAPE